MIEVQVTGEIRGLAADQSSERQRGIRLYAASDPRSFGCDEAAWEAKWTVVENQACQIWFDQENVISATWSGRCVDGKASGAGRSVLRLRGNPNGATFVGVMRGKVKQVAMGPIRCRTTIFTKASGVTVSWQALVLGDKKAAGTEIHFQKITYADGFRYEGQMRDSKMARPGDP